MKKAFITIVLIFYVAAGVGVGSMQHYCLLAENTPLQENNCCHAGSDPGHESVCRFSGEPSANEHANRGDTTLNPGCCEIQYTFAQLESESLLLAVDLPEIPDTACDVLVVYPRFHQTFYRIALLTADPSFQLNLPLLI